MIVQILLLDIVFSLDSVITAVGMADEIEVMIAAVVIAVGVMLVFAGPISELREAAPDGEDAGAELPAADRHVAGRRGLRPAHPEGLHLLRDGFSVFVEVLNLRLRKKVAADPVDLRPTMVKDPEAAGAVGHLHVSPADAEGQA